LKYAAGNATKLIEQLIDENPVMWDKLNEWEQMAIIKMPDLSTLVANATSMVPSKDG